MLQAMLMAIILIQAYLKKTGKSIIEATVTPTEEILEATKDFWQ